MMKLKKYLFSLFCNVLVLSLNAAEPKIVSVTAQQRYPWNGLVDIEVQLSGTVEELAGCEVVFAATNVATQAELETAHIEKTGEDVGSGESWTRHYVWDAEADVGKVKIDGLALTVGITKNLAGVQLWEGGPYFAECNVGATKPEEYGYYFWWGDTIGYKRNAANNGWVAIKNGAPFSFSNEICPTYDKTNQQLQSLGYIDSTGNLIATHDAATVHLGAPWRMPTASEIDELSSNCTVSWTEKNGIYGVLVVGKDAYVSKEIFLPAGGLGKDSGFLVSEYSGSTLGSDGYYWSSTPLSEYVKHAWGLGFDSYEIFKDRNGRGYGLLIRPVRGAADSGSIGVNAVTTNFCYTPAVFSAITYTNLKGATHTNPVTYQEGTTISFSAPSAVTGYAFTGWTPSSITATMTGAQTVRANWKANTYVIRYNANGGSGTMANTDATYDQNATLATCGFTRTGFEFVGWSLEKTARPESAPYRAGVVVRNLASNQGAVIELFAVWEPTKCAAPVVTPGHGSVFIDDTAVVSITCETDGAVIYYSTTGSTPKTKEANRYKGPFTISNTTTVKAVAVYTRTDGQTLMSDYVTVVITKKTVTFAEAVGALGLTFTSGGDAAWTIVTDVEANDGICVQSGKIGDDQTTWIETTLTGAGLFTFKWKSECEDDPDGATWDRLVCTIDGVEHSRIDGTIAWTQVSLSLNQGTHTIRWMYVKDESESEGRDCAWLDGVVWTPSSTCPPEIESADECVKKAFDAWISCYGVTNPSAANVNAFVLGLAPTATEEAIQAKVEAELKSLDLGKLAEGDISAAVAEIQAKYPNAKVDLAPIEDINTSARLFKLVIKLK